MHFKPRIFISSTLLENLKIRDEIKDFFESLGAEVMLYEQNLTPSTKPLTYRTDIKDADFVILIIKENYGTITKSGLSGTHEEFKILMENNIPVHIYIKNTKDQTSNVLVDDVNKNDISYFYFDDDSTLYNRIKKTVFTIARDIMLKKIEEVTLRTETAKKICVNHDYKLGVGYLKIFDKMIEINNSHSNYFIDSDLVFQSITYIYEHYKANKFIFVDGKLNELLDKIFYKYNEFICEHSLAFFPLDDRKQEFSFPIYKTITINIGQIKRDDDISGRLTNLFEELIDNCSKFKDYLQELKLEVDIEY